MNTQAITACAFIYKDNKVFIAKRASNKKFLPNKYELPGGHIEYGEKMEEGLKREIREEFNMEIMVEEPVYVFTYLNDVKQTHSIEVIYFARLANPDEGIKLNSEDHSDYRWIGLNEAKELLDPDDEETKAVVKGLNLLKTRSQR